jgi:hypothetical protein
MGAQKLQALQELLTVNIGMRPAPVKISDGSRRGGSTNFLEYPSDLNALTTARH